MPNLEGLEVMPYHGTWVPKSLALGRNPILENLPSASAEQVAAWRLRLGV